MFAPRPDISPKPGRADRLQVAVIGTGFVGPHHVDAARRTGYADVVAIAGTDRDQSWGREAVETSRGIPSLPAGHPEGWSEALRDFMRPFYAAILDRQALPSDSPPAYPTLADGVRAIHFAEAALTSAQQGGGWPCRPFKAQSALRVA